MTEPSEYELKTEDLKTNRLEQDRLANVLLALTSVVPILDKSNNSIGALRLYDRTQKFLELLKEEDLLIFRLGELRAKKEF